MGNVGLMNVFVAYGDLNVGIQLADNLLVYHHSRLTQIRGGTK